MEISFLGIKWPWYESDHSGLEFMELYPHAPYRPHGVVLRQRATLYILNTVIY
jgi:hypothetical protein